MQRPRKIPHQRSWKAAKFLWTVNQHLSTSMSIWPFNRNLKKCPLIDPEAHAFAPRQDGTNLENEAPNPFSILKKGITRINVLPTTWKETTEVQYRIECRYALSFQKNKSPGTEGLTAEFYSFFWDHLSSTMINSFNYGFVKVELSISQRQGIIRLIPKKNKNLSLLNNWRPISLLNVDYKIATKALALRLRKVLPSIMSDVPTGYIEGRFIGEDIRMISDIIHFTTEQNQEGIALFIDFEKAFDSLEWAFLLRL